MGDMALSRVSLMMAASVVSVAGLGLTSHAAVYYKSGTTFNMPTAAAWYTDAGGITVAAAAPVAADTVTFGAASTTSPYASTAAAPYYFNAGTTVSNFGCLAVTDTSATTYLSFSRNAYTSSLYGVGGVFIDMSAATGDMQIDGYSGGVDYLRMYTGSTYSTYKWIVAPGRNLTIGPAITINGYSAKGTLNLSGGGTFNIQGVLSDAKNGLTNFAVNNDGGTVTCSGTNTYTGITTVTAGTYYLNGSHNNAGNYTVDAAGRLSGTGTITFSSAAAQTVTVNGTLAMGSATAAIGTMKVVESGTGTAGVILAGTVNADVDAASGMADKLDVSTGSLTFGGTLNVAITGTPAIGASFDLFDFASETGTFSAINVAGLADGQSYSFDYTTGVLSVVTSEVPEPSSLALCGLGTLALFRRRRI